MDVARAVLGLRYGLAAGALATMLLAPASGAAGPLYADATLERYFALDWQATPAAAAQTIDGYVENRGNLPVERMRLAIDRLDAAGRPVGTSTVWVAGVIPANNRTYFTSAVPAAAGYRVRVVAFDWVNCRD